MVLTTVGLDVGETLVVDTVRWTAWADWVAGPVHPRRRDGRPQLLS